MTQIEPITSAIQDKVPQVEEQVFSVSARDRALSLIKKRYGISFLGPIRDGVEWILGLPVNPEGYAHVIEARKQVNQAANDVVSPEESKKAT